jgi:hypothetical protein
VTHANSAPVFAHSQPLTPEDFDIERKAQELILSLTEPHMEALGDSPLRHKVYRYRKVEERACPFVAIAALMIAIANNKGTEAELMAPEMFFANLRQMLSCGNAHRELPELYLEESRAEAQENEETNMILVYGATADRLERAAEAKRKEIATETELANRMERAAREMRLRRSSKYLTTRIG